jgi:hypothetical protein
MSHGHCTIRSLYKNYFTSDRLISNSSNRVLFCIIYELFCTFNIVPYEDLDVEFSGKVLMEILFRQRAKRTRNLCFQISRFTNINTWPKKMNLKESDPLKLSVYFVYLLVLTVLKNCFYLLDTQRICPCYTVVRRRTKRRLTLSAVHTEWML